MGESSQISEYCIVNEKLYTGNEVIKQSVCSQVYYRLYVGLYNDEGKTMNLKRSRRPGLRF